MKWMIVPIVFLVTAVACEQASQESKEAAAPNGAGRQVAAPFAGESQQVAVPTVTLHSTRGTYQVSVEVAQTDEERRQGLSNRESLAANSGMWFVFSAAVEEAFWMKDVNFPLDIIFVGSDRRVVDIVTNAAPLSTELIHSRSPYQYVLEVAGGYAEAHGIAIGDQVEFRIGPS